VHRCRQRHDGANHLRRCGQPRGRLTRAFGTPYPAPTHRPLACPTQPLPTPSPSTPIG
jgi:hypothetical protein